MPPSTLGAFAKSDPSLAQSDMEWHVQPLSPEVRRASPPIWSDHALGVQSAAEFARGHVRMAGADPLTSPKILCNYLSTDSDRRVAVTGLRITRQIMGALPFSRLPTARIASRPATDERRGNCGRQQRIGDDDLHPVGTWRWGAFDSQGRPLSSATVLDTDCRVHGVARPTSGGRFGHAHHHLREHQRAGDARRARGAGDPGVGARLRPSRPTHISLAGILLNEVGGSGAYLRGVQKR